jgi:serine O-acetyltransferase
MGLFAKIRRDFTAVKTKDPAYPGGLKGALEILLCYPGFHALLAHRLLHFLHSDLKIPVLPKFLGYFVRLLTGIEIHPGARIGSGVLIDHGMGVVIGATAVIEDDVTLYHGVTLGAKGSETGGKRHPTVKRGAFIGSGAKILGDVTVGAHSKVGAGSVVVRDVPPGTTVVGIPAKVVRSRNIVDEGATEVTAEIAREAVLAEKLENLQKELDTLRQQLAVTLASHEREAS